MSMNDVKRASLDNAGFRQRQQRRDILRANRKTAEREKAAQTGREIEDMHLYGHKCTLTAEQLAELAERVRHKACWRSRW